MKCKKDAGFSLVEMLVAIVILGIVAVPVSSGMLTAVRINTKAEELMNAQLAVSSAVETLMATGVKEENPNYIWYVGENPHPRMVVKTTRAKENVEGIEKPLPYYHVEVTFFDDEGEPIFDTVRTAVHATTPDGGDSE